MERWSGRVAVVTGASSGIGAEIAKQLVKQGLKVVGLARRVERVEDLSKSLKSEKGKLHAIKCDVTKEAEIKEAFQWIKKNLGGVDILINNAAANPVCSLMDGPVEDWRTLLDTNVFGLSVCAKEAIQIMKENNIDDGHIVNINSIAGHVPPGPHHVMYFATKHAVTVLTEGLRRELVKQKSKIRITSVSPGLVKTDMPPKVCFSVMPALEPEDIANGVLYALGTPAHVQVHELTIKPIGEAM